MEEMGLASRCCSSGAAQELHVLAVDDSVVDRTFIERLLKISCCKVTAVESGRMALQYLGLDGEKSRVGLDGLKVNLILTDYSMPGMTGYELLKKIKGSSALRKIPVVIMSSENILARIDRCLEEGAEDFLVKPVKLSDVKRIKDFVLREGEENGRKEDFVSKAGEKNEMKETRKRKYDVPLSPNQPESASPSSPTCDLPASTKSSSAALHSTPSLLDNAVDQSLACDPASLPESSFEASQELHSTRPRLGNAADSW